MKIMASAPRSIAILVVGLLASPAGPSLAATDMDGSTADGRLQNARAAAPVVLRKNSRHGLQHGKAYAHRKFRKVAMKPTSGNKKDAAADNAAEPVAEAGGTLPEIPPSIANANAQFLSPGVLGENARMMSERASDLLQVSPDGEAGVRGDDGTMLVAADQLNDVDRSLREVSPAKPVSANPPPAPVAAVSGEGSAWDKTSLIGKIFIGFGALLTMASAARMFMT